MTAPQAEIEVEDLGEVDRIIYWRDGEKYEHVFTSRVSLAKTMDRRYVVLHGGKLRIDKEGWIHG